MKLKDILLIGIYIFLMPIACAGTIGISMIFGTGLYDTFYIALSQKANDLMWSMFVPAFSILSGVICSIPIWFVDYKSEDNRVVRQIVAVATYVFVIMLIWFKINHQ